MRFAFLQPSKSHLTASIKSFYNQKVTKETRLIYFLILLTAVLGSIYIGVNALTTQYPGLFYLPMRWVYLSPFVFAITLLGMYADKMSPRLAYFSRSYGTFFFILISFAILTTGIQYTPFHVIDTELVKWDQLLGFNTPALMQWTALHPVIKKIFECAYGFLDVEMFLVPLLLGFCKNQQAVNRFFITILVAFLIGTTVYYFFPTGSPASIFQSPYFLSGEQAVYTKFYEVHHYQAVSVMGTGMISFPSFHVTWAILLCYALFDKKWIFSIMAVINVILIFSTLFLGWHYLIDVFGGIILAMLSIAIMELLYRYWLNHKGL